MTTTTRAYFLHALSPLHAGTGDSADVIDLPIARMKSTGIPFLPGSSTKGVLRDKRKPNGGGSNDDHKKWLATFGPETADAGSHAGAVVIGDARLLALPVRSFKGTFAWITSPLLLTLAKRDLGPLAKGLDVPSISGRAARLADTDFLKISNPDGDDNNDKLYLQDLDLDASHDPALSGWTDLIQSQIFPEEDIFAKRFAVVDDDTMSFLSEMATQVDQRIRIKAETGTVDDGALWIEESLPPETILIGLMEADRSRSGFNMKSAEVMNFALPGNETMQFGGKATVGRGRCRILSVKQVAQNSKSGGTPNA